MESTQPNSPGLPAHLMQQLHQAAQQVPQTGSAPHQVNSRGRQRGGAYRGLSRGQSNNPRYPQAPRQTNVPDSFQDPRPYHQSGYQQSNVSHQTYQGFPGRTDQKNYQQNIVAPRAGSEDDFPALGSTKSINSSRSSSQAPSQPPGQHAGQQHVNHQRAQDFQQRARAGFYRGQNFFPHQNFQGMPQQQHSAQQPQYQVQQFQADDFRRPPPQHQAVYNPMAASVANQRHALRKRFMLQSEYLETVAEGALQNQMPVEEQQEKEAMRQNLERIMHEVIREYDKTQPTIDPAKVKLKCYGSLASGFAVAGSDVDLLVTFPRDGETIGNIEEDIKRLFEKALLDAGYGARLLTQTRVPIMRVCETPTPDILDGLRRYRAKWEQDEQDVADLKNGSFDPNRLPVVTREQIEAVSDIFSQLGNDPGEKPLPPSAGRELPHLEYTRDCGIQCDINFSNYVALHNTRLLRTYCLHDERVRRMGLIVKAWAKARKINTPYHGTLSSYGYILMLLHFLMNITSPPVIPNLQAMAKDRDAWANRTEFETVDGFDVRFVSDPERIAEAIQGRPRNQEPLGALLRGFFWYYSDHQGFHWTNNVISIRTVGGALTKRSKGWTEAKWTGAKNTIRNRYLLCIEDPFETEHNIARTVCHSGIVAIRDEFRRARKILERIDKIHGVGWQWFEDDKEPGQDFMAAAEDRGDLLRKDYDFHKLKKLRAEAEATERALKEANALVGLEEGGAADSSEQDGTSSQHYSQSENPFEVEEPSRKLTQSVGHQQENYPPRRGRLRRLKYDSDDEGDEGGVDGNPELNATGTDMAENKGLSTSVRTSSSGSDESNESELYCFYGNNSVPCAVDTLGKPLPWNLDTQEGRWLHWRDNKVRNGTFTGILRDGLKILNEQCPFDATRPLPSPRTHHGNLNLIRPPFPMSKPTDEEFVTIERLDCEQDLPTNFPLTATENTGWDLSVSDCRWLSKRDECVRVGTFSAPNDPRIQNLHDAFPYLPNPSPEEQLRRNKILKQRNRQWLKGEISQHVVDDFSAYLAYLQNAAPPNPQLRHSSWDVSFSDGRWLCKRDVLVRDGLFRRPACLPEALQLHDDFPYIANTSPVVQHKRNLQLKLREIERQIAQIPEDLRQIWDKEMSCDSATVQANTVEPTIQKPEEPVSHEEPVIQSDFNTITAEEVKSDREQPRWTVCNRLGRWLNERDAAKLAGTWVRGNLLPWQRNLDKMFSFTTTPSEEEQAKRNEALSALDKNGNVVPVMSRPPDDQHKCSSGQPRGSRYHTDKPEPQLVSISEDDQDLEPEKTDRSWMNIQREYSTRNGRRLRWRDKQIKNGTWKGSAARQFQHLDTMFPYINKSSIEEQAGHNTRLSAMNDEYNSSMPGLRLNDSDTSKETKADNSNESPRARAPAMTDKSAADGNLTTKAGNRQALRRMEWDESLLLGSWLSWRDSKVRQRNWKDAASKPFLRWLDDTFPYIAKPTLVEHAQSNDKLRTISEDYPRLRDYVGVAREVRPSVYDMQEILGLNSSDAIPSRKTNRDNKAELKSLMRDDQAGRNDSIRSQRLNYFASKPTSVMENRQENQNPNGVPELTTKVVKGAPQHSSTAPSTATSAKPASTLTTTINQPNTPISSSLALTLVPQTLHCGPSPSCHADEDPKIMPIPSVQAFTFDAHQLRDLNIIQQGGNGCARFGEEWNIEPDSEWGGGGWMGHHGRSSEEQEGAGVKEREKWEGRGDEEGLLGELPCL